MRTTVAKWGNSLGVRIPCAIAQQVGFKEGTAVAFEPGKRVLTIRPLRRRKHSLDSLLARAKGPSPHRRLDRDSPVGGELL